MKIKSAQNWFAKSRCHRGMSSMEAMMLIVGLAVGYHLAAGWFNEWRGAEWTDDRLETLAVKAVATVRNAGLAGIAMVEPNNLDATLERLASGETAKSGAFSGQIYVVPELSAEKAREKLHSYLKVEKGSLALLTEAERAERS
ncbi:MAG: hypothetical protein KDM63_04145 [Verrucomicrobiae bacterium]|nr:hypothetical protein [Verrucomicrobiae bacterium]